MRAHWLLVISIASTLFTVTKAEAFSVSPLHWQATIAPGKEQILSETIFNNESTPVNFTITIGGVKQNDKGQPVFGFGFDEAEKWVVPQKKNLTLAPNEKKKIFITVQPNATAEPGTHYAALLIKKVGAQTGDVGIAGQTAILLEITVAGVVHEGLAINNWSVEKSLVTKPIWKTKATLQNTGTVSLPLAGKILISNWRGLQQGEQPLSLGNTLVPGANRALAPELAKNIFWPGPYRADIIITYGRSQMVARATQTLWYIPTWSVGLALTCFIVILLLIHLKKRSVRYE